MKNRTANDVAIDTMNQINDVMSLLYSVFKDKETNEIKKSAELLTTIFDNNKGDVK